MSSFSLSPVNCNFKISLILSTHICSHQVTTWNFWAYNYGLYLNNITVKTLCTHAVIFTRGFLKRETTGILMYMLHHKWSHDLSNKNNLQSNKSPPATWNADEVALHRNQENLGFVRINKKVVWHNTTLQHDGYPQQLCVTWINVFRRKQENIS